MKASPYRILLVLEIMSYITILENFTLNRSTIRTPLTALTNKKSTRLVTPHLYQGHDIGSWEEWTNGVPVNVGKRVASMGKRPG